MGNQPKPAKPDVTSFTLKTKSTRGFTSNMTGKMRSPEHCGVVTAALIGLLSDDVHVLLAAPDIRTALEETQSLLAAMLHEQRPLDEIEAQMVANRAALSKASLSEGGEA